MEEEHYVELILERRQTVEAMVLEASDYGSKFIFLQLFLLSCVYGLYKRIFAHTKPEEAI